MALSMGRKIVEIPKENEGFQRSWGGDARRGLAEFEPRVALNMGSKIIEIPKENDGFQKSGGVTHGAEPLSLSLEWPSVWGGKSLKFLRKMKDSRSPGGRCTARLRRI